MNSALSILTQIKKADEKHRRRLARRLERVINQNLETEQSETDSIQ